MIKSLHVYDFDGTVCDSSERYRTIIGADGVTRIDLNYWIENEYRTLEDSLLPLAARFKKELTDPSIYVVVATARIWDDLSVQFAKREGVTPQSVIARRNRQDTRKGADLKIQGIKKLLNLKQFKKLDTIHVFEDNIDYLKTLCDKFHAEGHYFPSVQGY
jgi:hypothetical protein